MRVTSDNYQQVLTHVLRLQDIRVFEELVRGLASKGVFVQENVDGLKGVQWEVLWHKLRCVNMGLTQEERKSSEAWCLKRGIFPGGTDFEEEE